MKKKYLYLLLFAFQSIFVLACKHEIPEKPILKETNTGNNNNNNGIPCNPDSVYFEKDIMPILVSNCTMSGCHGNGSAQDGVDLTSYESIMRTADIVPGNPGESDLYDAITEDDEDKRMPPPPNKPLSAEQISLIRKWIAQGAQNKKCQSGCDTAQITYAKTIAPLLTSNCTGCHNENLASGNVKLHSHPDVKIVADNGRLLGAISHANGFVPMPQGGNKLPDCKINQVKIWINAGAPNN